MKKYIALVAMILSSTIGIKAGLPDSLYAAIEQLDIRKVERLTQRIDLDDAELSKLIQFSQAIVEEQKQNVSPFKSWRDLTKIIGGGTLIAGATGIAVAASEIRRTPAQRQTTNFFELPLLRRGENWFNRVTGQQTANEQRIEAALNSLTPLLRHEYSTYAALGLGLIGGYFLIKGIFMTHARGRVKKAREIENFLTNQVAQKQTIANKAA